MGNKRIAIINSVYKLGSTGRICFEMQNYFINHGFDSVVFYGRNNQRLSNSVYFGNKLDLLLHGGISRITGKHGLYSKKVTQKLIEQLDRYKPDLYILHNIHGYYVNYELLLKYIAYKNVPVIMVLHDCWVFTGHCAYFSYNKCKGWEDGCKNCKFSNTYPSSLTSWNTGTNYVKKVNLINLINNIHIICPSNWMANIAKSSFLKKKTIMVINNGIDINYFRRTDESLFRVKNNLVGYKLILCVAYVFEKRKGIDDIIKLSALLQSKYRIIMLGKLYKKIKLPNNIIHIKRTKDTDYLKLIYSACDVMFNPTYEDTYSNVNMEAMSCGLPVICYRTGGAYEMIDQRYVVEQGDLYRAIDLINSIEDSCYDFTNVSSFSRDIAYEQYLNIVNKLV